jgi:DNA-nicking Smr family endonuclease
MSSLDLHGIKHSQVQILLDQFIWESMKKKQKEVVVITGHSKQMKDIVRNCVNDYNMICQEEYLNPGKFIIKLV